MNLSFKCSSASFYVECTSINGIENFVCKKPNVILFDVQNSDILEGETLNEFKADEKTGENWILAVDSDKVKPEFFDLADIPKTTRYSKITTDGWSQIDNSINLFDWQVQLYSNYYKSIICCLQLSSQVIIFCILVYLHPFWLFLDGELIAKDLYQLKILN